jgi:hypothetical protein
MDIGSLQTTLRRAAAELLKIADQAAIALRAGPDAKTHVLVDWENVQPKEDDCRALVPEATDVWLFHGPNQKNVARHYPSFGERATEVRVARTGKNALDFHLAFYLGYIAARHPDARFVVLSNDKGYGPMLVHAKGELGFTMSQIGFGAAKRARAPAKKAAATRAASPAPALAKTAVAKKVPARKAPTKATTPAKKPAARKSDAAKSPVSKAVATASKKAGKKTFDQVLAILRKSPEVRRPAKAARLLAQLASLIGAGADASDAEAMLARLVAEGRIVVDKNAVVYRL